MEPIISKQVPLLLVQVLTLTHYFPYRTSSELVPLDSPVRGTQKRVPYWGSSSYRFGVMAVQNVSPDSRETRALPPTCPQYTDDIYIYKCPLRLLVRRLEVVSSCCVSC